MTKEESLSAEARELLAEVRRCDGIEWHHEWNEERPEGNELVVAGFVALGPARGPERKWRRMFLR